MNKRHSAIEYQLLCLYMSVSAAGLPLLNCNVYYYHNNDNNNNKNDNDIDSNSIKGLTLANLSRLTNANLPPDCVINTAFNIIEPSK